MSLIFFFFGGGRNYRKTRPPVIAFLMHLMEWFLHDKKINGLSILKSFPLAIPRNTKRQARSQDFAQGGGGGRRLERAPFPSVQRAPSDSPKGPFSLTRGPSDLHRGPLNVHGALWSFREGPGGPKDL